MPQSANPKMITAHDAFMADSIIADRRDPSIEATHRGRGATLNPSGRFEKQTRHVVDDGWQTLDELPPLKTKVQIENPKTIISKNDSPDIPFERSINPFRGCEHGCIYCFARPTHSYMGLSAGIDFETNLYAKPNAAKLLEKELAKKNYKPSTIALGTNTDPYQPIEKQWRITREILETLEATEHPVTIVTKSSLVLRDKKLLARMASKGLAKVAISVTTLDRKLARTMEPRASTPGLRLKTLKELSQAGIPVSVMVAPVIPALNDHEIERILDNAAAAGATQAGYVLLRLPHEVSPLFREWLLTHYPDRYRHVMNLMRSMRGGKDYDAQYGMRLRGDGPYAWQIKRRFEIACKKHNLNQRTTRLRKNLFKYMKNPTGIHHNPIPPVGLFTPINQRL